MSRFLARPVTAHATRIARLPCQGRESRVVTESKAPVNRAGGVSAVAFPARAIGHLGKCCPRSPGNWPVRLSGTGQFVKDWPHGEAQGKSAGRGSKVLAAAVVSRRIAFGRLPCRPRCSTFFTRYNPRSGLRRPQADWDQIMNTYHLVWRDQQGHSPNLLPAGVRRGADRRRISIVTRDELVAVVRSGMPVRGAIQCLDVALGSVVFRSHEAAAYPAPGISAVGHARLYHYKGRDDTAAIVEQVDGLAAGLGRRWAAAGREPQSRIARCRPSSSVSAPARHASGDPHRS